MHLPDQFLSCPVTWTTNLTAALAVGAAWRSKSRGSESPSLPTAAVVAGLMLATQMVNLPMSPHHSAHLLGTALAACWLGPASGILVAAFVLAVQALCLGDGGVAALGANILNMAVVPVIVLSLGQRLAARTQSEGAKGLCLFAATAIGVLAAAGCCAVQLALSTGQPLGSTLGLLLENHWLIALAEGGLTTAAVLLGERLIERGRWRMAGVGLAAGLVLVSNVSSSLPDGLEQALTRMGLSTTAVHQAAE